MVHPSIPGSLVDMGPQGLVKSFKGRPVGYVATPATHHQLEKRRRAEWRGIKEDLSALVPEELASVLYDLFIGQQAVWLLLTQSEDLPQGDTKRPYVTGSGELTQQDALPGHPSYGQHGPALDAVVVAAVQVSTHPEIGDLDGEAPVQEAVPGGQVTVHEVQRRQVLHP